MRYVYPHKVQKKYLWSSFTFLVLPSVVSLQKPTEKRQVWLKNAAGFGSKKTQQVACVRAYKRIRIYMRMRGKHVNAGVCCSPMTFDRLVSPPKNEPVRMRTSICGRGQRAFQNRYIFCPDNAREERKVRRYSVLNSLTVERKCEEVQRNHTQTTPLYPTNF